MALKSTIFKAGLQVADMDRGVYGEHALTIARHPSETDERMMMRVLAFALRTPADDRDGALEFAKGLSDVDEPDLWQKSLAGEILQWVEVGQPDERRLLKACGRAERVVVYAYGTSAAVWWSGLKGRLGRARGLEVWQIDAAQSQALAALAQRTMRLQATVQDGAVWFGDATRSIELEPRPLLAA